MYLLSKGRLPDCKSGAFGHWVFETPQVHPIKIRANCQRGQDEMLKPFPSKFNSWLAHE